MEKNGILYSIILLISINVRADNTGNYAKLASCKAQVQSIDTMELRHATVYPTGVDKNGKENKETLPGLGTHYGIRLIEVHLNIVLVLIYKLQKEVCFLTKGI